MKNKHCEYCKEDNLGYSLKFGNFSIHYIK